MKTVMIISDATGETAERMVRAATLQFSDVPVNVRTYSRVRLETECEQLIEKAAELKALVVFTVVNAEERDLIAKLVERYNVESVDLIGALIGKLAGFLGSAPAGVPGLLHSITDDYFRRIEAVEFSLKGATSVFVPATPIVGHPTEVVANSVVQGEALARRQDKFVRFVWNSHFDLDQLQRAGTISRPQSARTVLRVTARNLATDELLTGTTDEFFVDGSLVATIDGGGVGDGSSPATASMLDPVGITSDAFGNLYVADAGNPVKVGGVAAATGTVPAAVGAAGRRTNAALSLNGALHTLTSPNPIADATTYAYTNLYATVGNATGQLVIKASPGRLRRVLVANNDAAQRYAQIHNTAAVGTIATGTMAAPGIPVPAGGFAFFDFSEADLALTAGIAVALSTTQLTYTAVAVTGQFSAQFA